MDNVTENLFYLCFFSTWRVVLKMFVRLLWIKQVKVSKKSLSGAIYNEKYGEMEAKRVFDNLRMSKLKEIFTTVAIACHRYKSLTRDSLFCKMFSPLFCFEQEKKKLFEETVCK